MFVLVFVASGGNSSWCGGLFFLNVFTKMKIHRVDRENAAA